MNRLESLLQFLNKPDTWIEIRLISKGRSIPKFYEGVNELIADYDFLKSQNENGFNVYYGILPRKSKPDSGGGSKEHVIDKADRLWLDVDVFSVKRPEEYENLTDEEIKARVLEKCEEAKKILESRDIHITVCVYSGRGFQPIIRLNKEIPKEGIEELNKVLIKFLRDHGFKVDNAWDCARVLRLPGFYNVKDNRRLLAELIELNDNVTDVEVIRRLKEELEESKEEEERPKIDGEAKFVNDLGIHLDTIRKVDRKLDELLEVIEHPDYDSPSEADMACASRLHYWRFSEPQIVEILRSYRYREKLERDDYIELTLSKVERSGEQFNPAKNPKLFLKLCDIQNPHSGGNEFRVFYDNKQKIIPSKPRNTRNTQNTKDTQNNTTKSSLFEPDCVQRARGIPDPQALKVILAWQKKRRIPEDKRAEFIDSFIAAHNLNLSISEYSELWKVPEFTCNYVQELGLCVGEGCRMKLPPAERLILDTESVVIFHSSGEMDVKVAGKRKIIPLKKFFRKQKSEVIINSAIFDEVFLECYLLPPNPPFSEEDAFRVYQAWLEIADHVKTPVDVESGLESTIIEILTTKRDYYSLDLLKEKKVPPKRGFFLEDGVIYVESELFKELLEEAGIKDRKEKVAKAIQRLLAGPSKRMRVGNELRYFWRFNLQAIQAILRR
ncbi:hypothetical protein [Archaeoglobus sp.]